MKTLLNLLNQSTILGFWDEIGDGLLNIIYSLIGPLLWCLCDIFFIILDLFEVMFKSFAGIAEGGVKVQGEIVEGDIVLFLFQSNLVMQIFMSILILSLFLLIIFTIFAIVKNQYAEKQEPVSKIINGAFKALLMYLLVPVATIVCLLVGNIVLQAIYEATSTQTGGSASDVLFVTSAYNANKLRDNDIEDNRKTLKDWYADNSILKIERRIEEATGVNESNVATATEEQIEIIASIVDESFVDGELAAVGSKWSYAAISTYYDGFRISYITIWVGGAFFIWALGKIVWGLIARIFKMTLYFAISPAVMATFPIDGGKALGSWRGEMVKNGTMAFCSVGVLNVLYSILPVFNNLDMFGGGIGGGIVKIFINIIAFSSAKDLIASISGWFGTGDALAEGIKAKGQYSAAKKKLTGIATKGVGMFAGITGGIDAASKHGGNKFWGAVSGGLSATPLVQNPFGEAFQKGQKAGEATYKTARTMHISGEKRKDKLAEYEGYDIVSSQNKAMSFKLDQMEADKRKEISKLDKESATYEKDLKEIEQKWETAINKFKATADYLSVLFDKEKRELEDQEKKNEKRQSNFESLDSFERAHEQDQELMNRVIKLSGATTDGAKQNIIDNWEQIKQGEFSGVQGDDEYLSKVSKAYEMFASDMASNDHEMKRAQQSMLNLATSSEKGLAYMQKTLGDSFGDMFDSIDGELQLKDSVDTSAISAKIKEEQKAINDALKKWQKDNDDLIKKMADKYGTSVKSDLEKIGKNTKK